MSQPKLLIVIAGPTAVGKSALAVALAKHVGTEIISADSRQFYQEMSIGVAKPSQEQLSAAPHHFISHKHVWENYSISDFENEALATCEKLFQQHNVLILCGGSGLYIDALCQGLDEMPATTEETRLKVQLLLEEKGLEAMVSQLKKVDPEFCQTADLKNPRRVSRAMEVWMQEGKAFSSFLHQAKKQRAFTSIFFHLDLPREILYERIDARCDQMMKDGLLEEVKSLIPYRTHRNLQSIGYTELFDYLEGKCGLDFAVEKIKQHSRNFAKRQGTWFRKKTDYQTISAGNPTRALEDIIQLSGI
jgi:tRNA dimethylallyltransferase